MKKISLENFQNKMIINFIFGFISGIAIGSFVPVSTGFFIFLFAILIISLSYKFFGKEEYKKFVLLFCIFISGFLIGVGRLWFSDLYTESKLKSFVGEKIQVEGLVVSEPDVREENTKLTVKVSKILIASTTQNVREKILVTVPLYPEFHYGDKVRMNVSLTEPSKIESDNGRSFDYKGYLRVRGIWYTSRYTSITLLSSGHGSIVKTMLFKIKNVFVTSINNVLPEPESSLLGGLLLGSKQSLGKELLTKFQKTGVSHIVVLSGYNIAIVASSIMSALKFLPNNFSFGFGVVSIILFTILSGGGASAWRAGIMVLVALFAKKFNRDYKASRILGFTILMMLAPNPLLLVFDPSFQLSILATIGLIFVSPIVAPYFIKVPEKFGLREIVTSTVATQITVLPFLIYNTGLLSIVSLPVNILILCTIPITMFLGFVTGVLGLISIYLAFIPGFLTYIFLWYQLTIIKLGAALPFSSVSLPIFSPLILVLVYAIISGSLYYLINKKT